MDVNRIAAFFDRLAPGWDGEGAPGAPVLSRLMGIGDIRPGDRVLDVACGTGVLTEALLDRGADAVLGMDVSQGMIACAREKFAGVPGVEFLAGDAEQAAFDEPFDRAVLFNAFPHFIHPQRLFQAMYDALDEGGRFTLAHGDGREGINSHHQAHAMGVSRPLPPARELAKELEPWFNVDTVVDEAHFYAVSGVKRSRAWG